MMMRSSLLFAMIVIAAHAPVSATAQPWADNFDSYALGSGLHGQGGWKGWDNSPATDAFVTDVVAHSTPHSVGIGPDNDVVHEFSGATSGTWVFVAWHYYASNITGEQQIVLLNTYNDGGPYNWSTLVGVDGTNCTSWNFIDPVPEASLPAIFDQWVEFRIEIDLVTDTQRVFYDGDLLIEKNWTDGGEPGTPGALDIAAVNLYNFPDGGDGTSYFDDLSLQEGPVPVQPASWGQIKAVFR